MTRAYLISFIFLSTITSICFSQTIKELQQAIEDSKNEIEKSNFHSKLAEKLYSTDFEEGYKNAQSALALSKKVNDKRGIAQALTLIGTYHYYKGNNQEALLYYQDALKSIGKEKTDDYPFKTFIRLSILYRHQAYFDSVRYYLGKAKSEIEGKEVSLLHGSWNASMGLLFNVMSQNEFALDFLKKSLAIRTSFGDSARVADTWRNMGEVLTDLSKYDSAEYCYEKAKAIINNIDDPELKMTLFLSQGRTNFVRGQFVKASENYTNALSLLKENTYKRYYGILLFKIGELYENQGAYTEAYDYLFHAMNEFENTNARQDQAKAITQIGWCYAFQNNFPLAIENANKSLSIAKTISDSASIGQNQNLIGYILAKQNRYDEALLNFEDALQIRTKLKNWWGVSYTLFNMATVNIDLGRNEKAYDLLFEALKINEEIKNLGGIVYVCNELGLLFAKDKKFSESSAYLARASRLAKEIPLPPELLSNYKNYIFLYESQKNNIKTIEYYKLYTDLKDSLSDEINTSRIAKADALFQLQKKANEIQLINKENEITQERNKAQAVELNLQRRIIIGIALGALTLTILIIIVYRLFVSNKKAKRILEKKNFEIIEQGEEIQAQSEELTETNNKLLTLVDELGEKNNEIELQSVKIVEANANLEKRVDERTKQLDTAYNELETFFYKTSHDFRRPLTTYLGLVEVAKVSVKDKHALDLFERVRETTVGLDKMLVKLQSISNVDYENQTENILISDIINDCLKLYNKTIVEREINVIIDNNTTSVKLNKILLRTIFENLIENSVNFNTPISPYLKISATQTTSLLTIIIEDNGQGIPVTIQHKIFEMYFRGHDNSKGNGLGLYVVKRAIEKLNGKVSFISRLNEGTSFKFTIPLNT